MLRPWLPRTQRNVSRNSKGFSEKMPGVVSAQGAPKRRRSKGRVSISIRGMPKFVLVDEAISLNEKRVALKRASLALVDELGRALQTADVETARDLLAVSETRKGASNGNNGIHSRRDAWVAQDSCRNTIWPR